MYSPAVILIFLIVLSSDATTLSIFLFNINGDELVPLPAVIIVDASILITGLT